MQAKIEKMKKDSQYFSESLKYWNREISHKRGRQRIAKGLSSAKSDTYVKALYTLGKARKAQEGYNVAIARLDKGQEFDVRRGESRARGAGRAKYQEILAKQAQIESSIDTTFGRNMDARMTRIYAHQRRALARNKEALGVFPEYGAPVMMPPKGDTSMANLSMFLGIAQMGFGLAAASDIRLKENIEEVGESLDGHNIYEWNYKHDKTTRYRGVIAQEVMKINPEAVGIRHNYLTVNYDRIDVDMEVVS